MTAHRIVLFSIIAFNLYSFGIPSALSVLLGVKKCLFFVSKKYYVQKRKRKTDASPG